MYLVWQGTKYIDSILGAKPGELFNVRLRRFGQNSFQRGHCHLLHHSKEAAAGHGHNQHGRWYRAGDAYPVWDSPRQEHVPTGSHDVLHSIANKRVLPGENIERLILVMMEMVRGCAPWRRDLVEHRKGSPSRFRRSLHNA